MKINTLLAIISCLTFLIRCTPPPSDTIQETYLIEGLDHGLLQSPINILSNEVHDEGRHNITVNFNGAINKIENLGHTVQLDIEPGNTITLDGTTFDFKQIHFHTPSEHLVDGMTFPMEMHVVNMIENPDSKAPEYLVISFLIKMGKENPFLKAFMDDIPENENEVTEVNLNGVKESIFFSDNVEGLVQSCYHYKGSLTTPPYTESVYWLVHKQIFEASPEQIEFMNSIEGDNARHIQSANKRQVGD